MSNIVILVRIFVSALLSGLVGLEREIHGRAAGLRTHILVGVGSTLFMITSILVGLKYSHAGGVDPSRIAAQVVTGIGFLGAGAIIRYGASIRGLTTAASIWAMAAIGLAVGAGLYVAAGITTVVVLAVLILSRVEERMALKQHGKKLSIRIRLDSETSTEDVQNVVEAYGGRIKTFKSEESEDKKYVEMVFDIMLVRAYYREITDEIDSLPGVEKVCWQ
ncbi:MgtC/SapB family protein [Candidatus Omnitrophota bacterium]